MVSLLLEKLFVCTFRRHQIPHRNIEIIHDGICRTNIQFCADFDILSRSINIHNLIVGVDVPDDLNGRIEILDQLFFDFLGIVGRRDDFDQKFRNGFLVGCSGGVDLFAGEIGEIRAAHLNAAEHDILLHNQCTAF